MFLEVLNILILHPQYLAIYEDLIKTQLNACGEEPTAPRKKSGQSKYAYETSKSYKQYQIDLIRWLDCMPYLPE